jgi:hypothetical protein
MQIMFSNVGNYEAWVRARDVLDCDPMLALVPAHRPTTHFEGTDVKYEVLIAHRISNIWGADVSLATYCDT